MIAGLVPQNRELFTTGFRGVARALAVYVAGLLMVAGLRRGPVRHTVALVAVDPDRSPQNVFLTGVNCGAAIVVGVAALALVSDIFGAPELAFESVR